MAWAGISRTQQEDLALNGNHCWAQDASGKRIPSNCGEGAKWLAAGKVLNNQCPVCGTMAKPYKVTPQCEKSHMKPGGGNTVRVICDAYYPLGVALIRCERCNAAFYQDAVAERR